MPPRCARSIAGRSSEQGMPSLDLMERAGAGRRTGGRAARARRAGGRGLRQGQQRRRWARRRRGCCARRPRGDGRVLLARPRSSPADARANLERLPGDAAAAARRTRSPARRSRHALRSSTRCSAPASQACPRARSPTRSRRSTAAGGPVVSVDVPSGVDASTGVVAGAAVSGRRTVTFHAAKPGLWIHPGKAHAGEVGVIDIGIPRGAPAERHRTDRRRACSPAPARAARLDQVHAAATCSSSAARAG